MEALDAFHENPDGRYLKSAGHGFESGLGSSGAARLSPCGAFICTDPNGVSP